MKRIGILRGGTGENYGASLRKNGTFLHAILNCDSMNIS